MAISQETRARRIESLLDAAEALIRRDGSTEFSIRELAQTAGVSPATPFNLLGSKAGLLGALLKRSMRANAGQTLPAHPIEALLAVCDAIAGRYVADAVYHRALLCSLDSAQAAPVRTAIDGWQWGVSSAVAAGQLAADTEPALLSEQLELQFIGALSLWVGGALPDARLVPQCHHGAALLLSTAATEASAARLRRHVRRAQRQLQALSAHGQGLCV